MSENHPIIPENNIPAVPAENEALGATIREILSPVLQTMAEFMRQSTEALNRVAAAQKVQSDRMEALEREIRLNTLVTPAQVKFLNEEIRNRARKLLMQRELDGNAKAVKKLGGSIRKSVLSRYGISALHDIPKHEYPVAMQQINTWNDLLLLRDIIREAENDHTMP